MEFIFQTAKELAETTYLSRYGEIIELMDDAVLRLRAGESEAAVWRVADAGLLLRRKIELYGNPMCLIPTGRGAELPRGNKLTVVK
jgi:hypothetical protein